MSSNFRGDRAALPRRFSPAVLVDGQHKLELANAVGETLRVHQVVGGPPSLRVFEITIRPHSLQPLDGLIDDSHRPQRPLELLHAQCLCYRVRQFQFLLVGRLDQFRNVGDVPTV